MSISVSDVPMGKEVQGSDGESIGKVNEMVNSGDANQTENGAHLFMEVKPDGALEFWKEPLYIPFSAIASVAHGNPLALSCTAAEAKIRYSTKPKALS